MKYSMKLITCLFMVLFIIVPAICFAEVKEIIADGTYIMGDGETPVVAEERALLQAKRAAVEEAGVYIESYSQVQNLRLTKDEISIIASGIVETVVLEKQRLIADGGIKFWVKVKCTVNTDSVASKLHNSSTMESLRKIQEDYAQAMQQIDELKKKLAQAQNEASKKEILSQISNNDQKFTAIEWFEKATEYSQAGNIDKAIEAYSKAIEINPNYSYAYCDRGVMYQQLGKNDLAIDDYNKAILVDDKNIYAYYNRASQYSDKQKAMEEYNKVISINPNFAEAYVQRGIIYFNQKKYSLALDELNKALILNPDINQADVVHTYCGDALSGEKLYTLAIASYTKAIELNPKNASAYIGRGYAYSDSHQYELALKDFLNANAISPELNCHFDIALTYENLKRIQEAIDEYRLYLKYANAEDDKSIIAYVQKHITVLEGKIKQ